MCTHMDMYAKMTSKMGVVTTPLPPTENPGSVPEHVHSLFSLCEHCFEVLILDDEYDNHKCRHSNDQDDE